MALPIQTVNHQHKYQGLEFIKMPVVLVDSHFNILHFNKAFTDLLRDANTVFPPQHLKELFEGLPETANYIDNKPESEKPALIEEVRHLPTGKIFDLHLSQIDKNLDHLDGFTVTCIDVTDKIIRNRTNRELSEQHIQMLNQTNTGVIIHKNGLIVYANNRAGQLIGLHTDDTLVGKTIWPFVTEGFKSKVAERIKGIIEQNNPAPPIEEHLIKLDGSIIEVEVFAFPVSFEGEFGIKTIITDISDRKHAEKQLINSRQQYYNLVENLTDIVFQTDTEAKFIYLNGSWEKTTGYAMSETLGKFSFDYLHHPHDTDGFYLKVRKLLTYGAQDVQYDLMLRSINGNSRFVEVSLKPILNEHKEIVGINGIIRDIHDKKITDIEVSRIQKTLKKHQSVLVSLTQEESIIKGNFEEALKTIVQVTANTLDITCVNVWAFNEYHTELHCLMNYDNTSKQFIDGVPLTVDKFPVYFKTLLRDRIIVADDAVNDPRTSEFNEIYNVPQNIYSMMDIAISKGETIWGVICVENRTHFHKWTLEDQSFARSIGDFIALAHKSSMLNFTQNELIKRENLYRSLIEQATDAVIIIDAEDRFVEVNDAMCKLSGYSRQELLNMTAADLVPKRFIGKKPGVRINPKYKDNYFGERIFINKHGEERIAEISARIFPDGRVQGIGRDITERKKQEQALRDSEARLELALKGADLGIWDFYIQENKMVHNKRWAEMLGYYFENTIVNQQFWEKFIHPDDKDAALNSFQSHLRGETPFYESTVRMLASNGDWRWIMDKGKIMEWDKQGNPIRASGIHQDITTIKDYQQQLIHQRKFLQEIINATPNLIYVRNVNNEFVTVNNTFTDFLEVDNLTIINYNSENPKHYSEALAKLTERDSEVFFARKMVVIDEHMINHPKNGIPVWFQTIKLPLLNEAGEFSEVLSVSMDITEIKIKEQQLSHLNDQLENKVRDRTAMLEAANKELETFNYSVSHDLRTPLRSIDIFAYFLDKNYNTVLDKDGLENIRQIRRSIIKMSSLIDNLLIFSKIGRSELKNVEINTHELVEEIINGIKEGESITNFKIHFDDLPNLYGDYEMIKRAIVNLLGNAVKYSRFRKKPSVQLYGFTKDNLTTISIKDNGVGFSMDLKDKLFTAFKRLHSEEHFEGTGVGLAIVERIIKRHGGSITAESKEDVGSTFTFTLPVKPVSQF